ncbi:hypothetical protein [Roseobacter sp. MH60115]|uniref:hypothetical protein n=1 Tax=Roseobacter sp. MH60115 TaxID=2785324 RepID=UPI0018A30CE7|nr:hypothetical protein [Roseobacter sp. MH60115]
MAEPVGIGRIVTETFDICDVDLGSRSRDRSGEAKFSAPLGYRILGHEIYRKGHHSGTEWNGTDQAGELSYDTGVMTELNRSVREGFLTGIFSFGDDKGDASAAAAFAKFMKAFKGHYRFYARTNSTIRFKWWADSESYDHGSVNVSHAEIRMEQVPTEDEAAVATEVIKFAIEKGEKSDIVELLKLALGEDFKQLEVPDLKDPEEQKKNLEEPVKDKPKDDPKLEEKN